MSPLFRPDTITARAAELRGPLSTQPPFSTRRIVELAFPDALVTGSPLPEGVDEMVTMTDDGPVILYRRGLPTPDQRAAIAHAMAHLVFDLGSPQFGCRPGFAGSPKVEARADLFAAELLAPLEHLRRHVWIPERPTDDVSVGAWLDMLDEISSHFQCPHWITTSQISRIM